MKSMNRSLLLATLTVAALAFSSAPVAAQEANVSIVKQKTLATASRHLEVDLVVRLPMPATLLPTEQEADTALLQVQLVRADQYALRQIDRQRPDVTPTWRECPSC